MNIRSKQKTALRCRITFWITDWRVESSQRSSQIIWLKRQMSITWIEILEVRMNFLKKWKTMTKKIVNVMDTYKRRMMDHIQVY